MGRMKLKSAVLMGLIFMIGCSNKEESLERARAEQSRHLMKDFNKPMKAKKPMTKFPSLGSGAE